MSTILLLCSPYFVRVWNLSLLWWLTWCIIINIYDFVILILGPFDPVTFPFGCGRGGQLLGFELGLFRFKWPFRFEFGKAFVRVFRLHANFWTPSWIFDPTLAFLRQACFQISHGVSELVYCFNLSLCFTSFYVDISINKETADINSTKIIPTFIIAVTVTAIKPL